MMAETVDERGGYEGKCCFGGIIEDPELLPLLSSSTAKLLPRFSGSTADHKNFVQKFVMVQVVNVIYLWEEKVKRKCVNWVSQRCLLQLIEVL